MYTFISCYVFAYIYNLFKNKIFLKKKKEFFFKSISLLNFYIIYWKKIFFFFIKKRKIYTHSNFDMRNMYDIVCNGKYNHKIARIYVLITLRIYIAKQKIFLKIFLEKKYFLARYLECNQLSSMYIDTGKEANELMTLERFIHCKCAFKQIDSQDVVNLCRF